MTPVEERIGKYRVHPVAAMFPLLEGELWQEFKNSMKVDGQIDPIIVQDDLLIDGRNRLRACLELGIEPRIKEYVGTIELSRYIILKNVERRNLNADQRTAIVTKAHAWQIAQQERQQHAEGGKKAGRGRPQQQVAPTSGQPIPKSKNDSGYNRERHARSTVGQIAAEAKSTRYKAQQAITVQKNSPAELDHVITGSRTLNDATKHIKSLTHKRPASTQVRVSRESEIDFLQRLQQQILDRLKEVDAIGRRAWNVENSSKRALAQGLHDALREIIDRLNGIPSQAKSQTRGQSAHRREDAASRPHGEKRSKTDDSENQFDTTTVN